MFSSLFSFIFNFVTSALGCLLVVRGWAYACGVSQHESLMISIRQLTDWLVRPLRRVVPTKGRWYWPAWVAALLVALVVVLVYGRAAVLVKPLIWITPFFIVLRWLLEMMIWGILGSIILNWASPRHPLLNVFWMLFEPIIVPVRRILPSVKNVDLGSIAVIIGLNLILIFLVLPITSIIY